MVLQVVWFRMLGRAFGGTAAATATVLAVFMAGLGLGAQIAGRSARRRSARTCLGVYAGLELGIAAMAALSPWLLGRLPATYAWLLDHGAVQAGWLTGTRVIASACAMLPPTLLMGATLPFLLQAMRPASEHVGRAAGTLYAANNVGAVVGALLASVVLLRAFGETRTALLSAALNLAAAALAWWARPHSGDARAEPAEVEPTRDARADLGVLCCAAGTGLVMLGYEVIWTRTLGPLFGSTVYAFGAILAVVLIGLALGSMAAARYADRLQDGRLDLCGVALLSVVMALAGLQLAPELIPISFRLLDASDQPLWQLSVVPGLIAACGVLLPSALSGAALPMAIRVLARGQSTATAAGSVYAANTLGSVVGSLATGLLLIPAIGSSQASVVLALVGAALCAVPAWTLRPWRRSAGVLLLPCVALIVLASRPPWNVLFFSGGIHMTSAQNRRLVVEHGAETRLVGSEVLYLAEGAGTTVLVERRWGQRSFFVDGKPEATDGMLDMRNQYLLAHLPALLHGAVRRSLVVGLGSGMTAGALTLYGQVDVAELSDVVPKAANFFADLNHDVVSNPRAHIHIADGRTFLRSGTVQYDVITVDPIHPYVAGASALYTKDYFAAVRERLQVGGIVSHWLPLYQLGWDDTAGVIRSFLEVFPDATLYNTDRDAILIGNAGPTIPSTRRIGAAFDLPAVRGDLARVFIDSPEELVATASLGAAELRALTRNARVITDDHTWIEFTAPRWFQQPTLDNLRRLLAARLREPADPTAVARRARESYTAILASTVAQSREEHDLLLARASSTAPASREIRWRLVNRVVGFRDAR